LKLFGLYEIYKFNN